MTLAQFVVAVTIALTTIAVALIVGAVILMEKEQKEKPFDTSGLLQLPEERNGHIEPLKGECVLYLCDKKKECGVDGCDDCKFTADVLHAKNFIHDSVGICIEIEKSDD